MYQLGFSLPAKSSFSSGRWCMSPAFIRHSRTLLRVVQRFVFVKLTAQPVQSCLTDCSFHPNHQLQDWLVSAQQHRRHGIGQGLVKHVIQLVQPPAELLVTTFGADIPGDNQRGTFMNVSASCLPNTHRTVQKGVHVKYFDVALPDGLPCW